MSTEKIIVTVPLSRLIGEISKSIITADNRNLIKFESNGKTHFVTLYGSNRYALLFSPDYFFNNYFLAFGHTFAILGGYDQDIEISPAVSMKINQDVSVARKGIPNIYELEIQTFRFATCLLFGLKYNIRLADCNCYPTTDAEYFSLMARVGLNCLSINCRAELEDDPSKYDEAIHTPCSDNVFNSIYLSLQNIITDKVILEKINIVQGVLVE